MKSGASRCFVPRHGVRVVEGKIVCDFLICFECGQMVVFSGEEQIDCVEIGGRSDMLNEILKKANVPLPEQAK